MTDLRDLYQEVIFDHNRHPRNRGPLPGATHHAEGHNPLCGDRVTVHVLLERGVIQEARFEGEGCAISTASASLMTEAMKGKTPAQAEQLFADFHKLVTGAAPEHDLGKLEALGGVREFPMRVKCATLAWHTLNAALHGQKEGVSTE
jgi:nitrogen fixation NifU-like protein